MKEMTDEIGDLVVEFGGGMSREHGDGLARSHLNEKLFKSFSFRWLRARPSPCSLLMPPPNSTTRSPISSVISFITRMSRASFVLLCRRMSRHAALARP